MSLVFIGSSGCRRFPAKGARNDCRALPPTIAPVFFLDISRILFYKQIGIDDGVESPVENVTVYRVDYVRKSKIPIGQVVERRAKERGGNLFGLLRMARKTFASTPEEAFHIAVGYSGTRVP
jgi:hypothetical protein